MLLRAVFDMNLTEVNSTFFRAMLSLKTSQLRAPEPGQNDAPRPPLPLYSGRHWCLPGFLCYLIYYNHELSTIQVGGWYHLRGDVQVNTMNQAPINCRPRGLRTETLVSILGKVGLLMESIFSHSYRLNRYSCFTLFRLEIHDMKSWRLIPCFRFMSEVVTGSMFWERSSLLEFWHS